MNSAEYQLQRLAAVIFIADVIVYVAYPFFEGVLQKANGFHKGGLHFMI